MSQSIPSSDGQLKFMRHPKLKPWYAPIDALHLGIFGGSYFFLHSNRKGINTIFKEDILNESQYKKETYDQAVNYFGTFTPVRNRWMSIPGKSVDPLGWFQWYCRYYEGRVTSFDDERVSQWRKEIMDVAFPIINGGPASEINNRFSNDNLYRVPKQQLLELAWDPTKNPQTFL